MNTCFGCGEDNPRGLQMGLLARIQDDQINIEYKVPSDFDGFQGIVHGGIVATILDEAMGLATSRIQRVSGAVTANLDIRFRAPVRSETPINIWAKSERDGRKFNCSAEIRDADGKVLAEATSLWILAGQAAE